MPSADNPAMRRLLTVALGACVPVLAGLLALHPVVNHDLGFHLRTGELVLESGIPTTDPFSFTVAGAPWFLEQWLGATAFWAVWRAIGIEGLVIFKALVVAVSFLLVALTARRSGASLVAAVAAGLLAAVAASPRFNAQPFVFSFAALALTAWQLERYRRNPSPRAIWPLVALFLFWPHVHVGYMVGLTLFGCFGIGALLETVLVRCGCAVLLAEPLSGRATGHLLGAGVVAGIGALLSLVAIHPVGASVPGRVWEIFASGFYRQAYQEMAPLSVAYGVNAPIILLWGAPPVVWLLLRRRLVLAHVVAWCVFVVTGVQVGRMVAETSIVLAPVWALAVTEAWTALSERGAVARLQRLVGPKRVAGGIILFTLLTGANFVRNGWARGLGWLDYNYPRSCYAWIDEQRLPPRMFNDMFFGGSFIFHFYPKRRVFIDGRTVYPEEFFRSVYQPIKLAAPGWQQIIDRAGIDWFLLAKMRFARLHRALQDSPDWQLAHVEGTCVIYTRTQADGRGDEENGP